ncbi:hypothetical protein DPMN_067491 [Dreissena polymorpha]|uniref:Uncharacterized protein n=1 Tax=Dreissena polymorpha TaxID=45954 RepID=A0A9D3YXD7_DREPO|nr:hypothetical protein DPMN_067491 [Dreissena polymorpha]
MQMLQSKISKMEQLLQLKDLRIADLTQNPLPPNRPSHQYRPHPSQDSRYSNQSDNYNLYDKHSGNENQYSKQYQYDDHRLRQASYDNQKYGYY